MAIHHSLRVKTTRFKPYLNGLRLNFAFALTISIYLT